MPITARTIAALPPQWLRFIPASSLCRCLSIPPWPRTLKGSLAAAPKKLTDFDEKVTDIARSIAHELKLEAGREGLCAVSGRLADGASSTALRCASAI